jgi:hypothetical protein
MAAGTPEQAQAGMEAWMAWAQRAGDAVIDPGAPLAVVEAGGDAGDPVGGFSILQAEDPDALVQVLDGHPHSAMGGTIEILPTPGM